mmetsp:Transcript_57274/g.140480  ORF Transcript_57274/g.140480 Transcript_57274/m.140480 type:complete len:649 (-) Transcript_57274:72-2018(-)
MAGLDLLPRDLSSALEDRDLSLALEDRGENGCSLPTSSLSTIPGDLLAAVLDRVGLPALLHMCPTSRRMMLSASVIIDGLQELNLSLAPSIAAHSWVECNFQLCTRGEGIMVSDRQIDMLSVRCKQLEKVTLRGCELIDSMTTEPFRDDRRCQGWAYNALSAAENLRELDLVDARILRRSTEQSCSLSLVGGFLPTTLTSLRASRLQCKNAWELWRGVLSCTSLVDLIMPVCHESTFPNLAKCVILLGGKCAGLRCLDPGMGSWPNQLLSVSLQALTLGCTGLRVLDLTSAERLQCDSVLATLSIHAKHLEGLALWNELISDNALGFLRSLTDLQRLHLADCSGFSLSTLSSISIANTAIVEISLTSHGSIVRHMLPHKLATLSLIGTHVPIQGLEAQCGEALRELYLQPEEWFDSRALCQVLRKCTTKLELLYLEDVVAESDAMDAVLDSLVECGITNLSFLAAGITEGDALALLYLYNLGSWDNKGPDAQKSDGIPGLPPESLAKISERLFGGEAHGAEGKLECASLLKAHNAALRRLHVENCCSLMAACISLRLRRKELGALHTLTLLKCPNLGASAIRLAVQERNAGCGVCFGARKPVLFLSEDWRATSRRGDWRGSAPSTPYVAALAKPSLVFPFRASATCTS